MIITPTAGVRIRRQGRAARFGLAPFALAAMLAMCVATAARAGEADPAAPTLTVLYKGRMVDESRKPISGIYAMTFKLYDTEESRKARWSETMWVAVDRGAYAVTLGQRKPLPTAIPLHLVLGVEVRGIGELVREPLSPSAGKPPPAAAPAAGAVSSRPAVQHADTTPYAVETDHAKNTDRIQDLTVDDLRKKLVDLATGSGSAKSKVGAARRFGALVGGEGGAEFNDSCPKGYLMVGIKGATASFIDSLQIICAPLE